MDKCYGCGKTFDKPEQITIGAAQHEIKLICPFCGDDRITHLWDEEPKGKEKKEKE